MKNAQGGNFKYRIIGIIGLIISFFLIYNFKFVDLWFTNFYAWFLGPERPVSKAGGLAIQNASILINLSIFLISLVLLFLAELKAILNKLIDTQKAFQFFMTDELCSKKQLPVILFVMGSIVGIFYNVFQLTFGQPAKEGFMEDYATMLYVFACFALLASVFTLKRSFFTLPDRYKIIVFLFVLMAVLTVIFGEEVSWGQRVIGYESFGVFEKYNYQEEVNFHNFFNPLFKYLYPIAGIGLFGVLLSIWLFDKKDKSHLFYLLVPHQSLFVLVFFMAASTYNGHSEIFEELVSVFSFLYAVRLFFCLTYPIAMTPVKLE
ncbi:MAG: hypothetical protein WCP85_28625 [Mariniphaga sp.]